MAILDATSAQGKDTNAIMQGWIDRGPWTYWDNITVAANTQVAATYSAFSVPIGSPNPLISGNPAKTKLQTNMVRGNQFPPPRCLLLNQIGFYFETDMAKADIDLILKSCYFEFRIDEKVFHEGHMQLFPSGAGLSGVSTQNGESVYNNGLPAPQYTRRMGEWSKYIAPQQQFSMNINFPGTPPTLTALGTGWNMWIYLDGLTDRSVQ